MTDTRPIADDTPRYRVSNHTNDHGDWCPFSLVTTTHTETTDELRCPQDCRASAIELIPPTEYTPGFGTGPSH